MNSIEYMLVWQIWRRHRLGLMTAVAWLGILCLTYLFGPTESLRPYAGLFALLPFSVLFFYLLGVFSLDINIDVTSPKSGFPRRLFTLPVGTSTLVVWPMALGTAVVMFTWAMLAACVMRPSGIYVSLWTPGLILAVVLAWFQVCMWFPFGVAWGRIASLLLGYGIAMGFVAFNAEYQLKTEQVYGMYAALLTGAYVAGFIAVRQARRGNQLIDTVDAGKFDNARSEYPLRSAADLPSPTAAQLWMEWRASGRLLTLGVAVVCAAQASMMAFTNNLLTALLRTGVLPLITGCSFSSSVTIYGGLWLLGIPILVSICAGVAFGRTGSKIGTATDAAFLFVRPMTNVQLVGVKCLAAAKFAVTTCATTVVVAGIWMWWTDDFTALAELRHNILASWNDFELFFGGLLLFVALVAVAWICAISLMPLGLAGRTWLIFAANFFFLSVAIAVGASNEFLFSGRSVDGTWRAIRIALPWLAFGALTLKIALGIFMVIKSRGLCSKHAFQRFVGGWCTAVVLSIGVMGWCVSFSPRLFGWLSLVVVLCVPFSRFALALNALAWNRHR